MAKIKNFHKLSLLIGFLLCTMGSIAQLSKKVSLQKQYNATLIEIKQLQNAIDKANKEQKTGITAIALINTKIEKRKKLLSTIESQKREIDVELEQRMSEVGGLKGEIEVLRKEYTKLILWLSKNHNKTNKLAFVLEAHNFKEAYHRIKYIKKYSDYRAKQSTYLTNQVNRILGKINALNLVKKEKQDIIITNKHQQKQLMSEKQNRDSIVQKLSTEITKLKEQVKLKNQKAAQINEKIRSIIEQEIRKQNEKLLAEAKARRLREDKKNNVTPSINSKERETLSKEEFLKTPEGMLSNSFQTSKGTLPWPVNSGVITSKFGRQPHPADPELFVDNNGIDIKTNTNSVAKSVYKGKVVRIFEMPTYQNCVMVKHGEFFTIYSYLESVSVSEGMEINTGQSLGVCGFDDSHGYSLVNIQIWNNSSKLNPQAWLSAR